MSRRDAMAVYDDVLAAATADDPWLHAAGEPPRYAADYELLADMLTIPRRAGSVSETGVFPRGIDLWLSHELRRAGFTDQETWPRASAPRVLPREIHLLLENLPRRVRQAPGFDVREWLTERVAAMPSITPIDARILGRAYDKQVDVCVSRWDTGPELLISTKAQVVSFGKNLPNRYEEALGDAANLMARYPLAAVGFFFVQRATILRSEPDAFERTVDMMRKLRQDSVVAGGAYTATGLCLVDWPEGGVAQRRARGDRPRRRAGGPASRSVPHRARPQGRRGQPRLPPHGGAGPAGAAHDPRRRGRRPRAVRGAARGRGGRAPAHPLRGGLSPGGSGDPPDAGSPEVASLRRCLPR